MIIDFIFQTGKALAVRARQIIKLNTIAIWQDESCPDHKSTALTESDYAIIPPNQARALRDEQVLPCHSVIDILGNLPNDLARLSNVSAYGTDLGLG